MLTENTVTKLQEMKLTAMARAFKEQLTKPNINGLAFEDRFGLLVDQEWTSRKNNHLKRLIKQAKFSETGACVEDIEYHSDRNLDSAQIARLASCNYITERHNILLLGATGSGKTYLACALGMAAVRNFLSVRYVRLPELLTELAIAYSNVIFNTPVSHSMQDILAQSVPFYSIAVGGLVDCVSPSFNGEFSSDDLMLSAAASGTYFCYSFMNTQRLNILYQHLFLGRYLWLQKSPRLKF